MKALDLLNLVRRQLNIFESDSSVLQRDAAAESIRQGTRLVMNFLEHEVSVTALASRHRIPGNFLHRPLNDLSLAVEQSIRAESHFTDLAVFEKGHFARVIQQRRNIGCDKGFALGPADHDGGGILGDDQTLGIAAIEKQQRVGAVDFAQSSPHRIEKVHAALDLLRDQMSDNLGVGLGAELDAALT